jgi:PRTRC genetic system protein E
MPLLAGRTVLITVAKVDDKTLRVNVAPTQAKADENPARTTPLTYTGPPEELDAELGKHLAGYVQTHEQTASTLAEAKATMEAAAKAAQEEAKRKAEERKKASQKPPATATTAEPASSASSTPGEAAPSSASAGAWSVPAACAYPSLPISPPYLAGKIHIFNPHSRMRPEQCALPVILKASSGYGKVSLAGRGFQFRT